LSPQVYAFHDLAGGQRRDLGGTVRGLLDVAPFWGNVEQAPDGTTQIATLAAGEVMEGVDLRAQPSP